MKNNCIIGPTNTGNNYEKMLKHKTGIFGLLRLLAREVYDNVFIKLGLKVALITGEKKLFLLQLLFYLHS